MGDVTTNLSLETSSWGLVLSLAFALAVILVIPSSELALMQSVSVFWL